MRSWEQELSSMKVRIVSCEVLNNELPFASPLPLTPNLSIRICDLFQS